MNQLSTWNDSTASVSGGRDTTFSDDEGRFVSKKDKKLKARKRTTSEEDYQRLAERVWRRGRGKIKNKADFISVYEGYMVNSSVKGDSDLRESVFGSIQKSHSGVSSSIVTKKERVKAFVGAGKKPSAAEFEFPGVQKGRRVYSRRTKFRRGVREFTVYRDKKGRFVSVK